MFLCPAHNELLSKKIVLTAALLCVTTPQGAEWCLKSAFMRYVFFFLNRVGSIVVSYRQHAQENVFGGIIYPGQ